MSEHLYEQSQPPIHPLSHDSDLQQALQQLLTALQLDDAPAGGALAVYQAGHCIAQASVGMAQQNVPWQPTTLSLNFSTGKGVLATLIHVLATQKLLDYDVPIAQYWPEFAAQGKAQITLRTVMAHQADLFAITALEADSKSLLDWQKTVAQVAAMPTTAPNQADNYVSAYSALVYGWVLGGVIERVTDMPLSAALSHYLTEPLGIADSCYFGAPDARLGDVARLAKDFDSVHANTSTETSRSKRRKPVLKPDSAATLATYAALPSYGCWQQLTGNTDKPLTGAQINGLYFDQTQLNLKNYKAALLPSGSEPIHYYNAKTLQASLPAANGVASAQALATIYAMIANGGQWQGKTLIAPSIIAQLTTPQATGQDGVMPANMGWRLGYHRLFQLCTAKGSAVKAANAQGFGHMGYNGSVAWCDPTRQLSFAFVHNFDVTMLNDIRQFALTEAVISKIGAQMADTTA